MSPNSADPITIAGESVAPGRTARLELPIARLTSGTPVALPLVVLHGRTPGPVVWISAAVHGDEICGVEITRRVLGALDSGTLAGTVIAVPVVNVHGFNTGDRYLPDRRDLNRSFPGSRRGSLAAQIANLLVTEVVSRCSVGIDLHTGSDHRINLPQIRADLDDPDTMELARAFAAPIAIHSRLRDGSLRQVADDLGTRVLLFEGGEAHRFDAMSIEVGSAGILRVLSALGMVECAPSAEAESVLSRRSRWIRAAQSGILNLNTERGSQVAAGETLGSIHDPFGERLGVVKARDGGIVIGHTQHPLVNRGDAVAHIAEVS